MARRRLLIVDGYNVMGAWAELTDKRSMAEARELLTHRLSDYAGFSGQQVVVVFDAYLSGRAARSEEEMGLLRVVYTQKNETADHYIERMCDERAREIESGRLEVRVATSDAVEQTVIMGRGAMRLSSRELIHEMTQDKKDMARLAQDESGARRRGRSSVADRLPAHIRERLEKMRRGE